MGPIKINKYFFRLWTFFTNISKYIRNLWLKIDFLAILDLLNMMDGSDRDCGTDRVGFQSQNRDPYINA